VRQRTDRDEVDSGLRVRPHRRERDPAGCLELRPPVDELDGAANLLGRHVVEQDPLDSGLEGLGDVVERLRFDLDWPAVAQRGPDGRSFYVHVDITVLKQGPAYIKQTADYTLVERGARWKIKVKLLRVGEEQTLGDSGMRIDLMALFRELQGTVEIDPARPLIAAGTLTVESRMHAKVTPPNQAPIEQMVEDTGTVTFSLSETPR